MPEPARRGPQPPFRLHGTVISAGRREPGTTVVVTGGRIAEVSRHAHPELRDATPPGTAVFVPGLVDVHCHGGGGTDFSSSDEKGAHAAADFHRRSGTTSLVGSLVSSTRHELVAQTLLLRRLVDDGILAGIHLEGPFLSTRRCGAQDPARLVDPARDLVDAVCDAAKGAISSMTFAPELPGADQLVEWLVAAGVVPSIGHTDASFDDTIRILLLARRLMVFGRPTVTHLFNGMRPIHHRDPGPAAAALGAAATADAVVELIGDGVHLDPGTVTTVFQLVGHDNIALVTDAMAAAGMADGDYRLGDLAVTVSQGVARLADGELRSIAGGTSTLLQVVRRTIAGGVAPEAAVAAATATPAAVLGLDGEIGAIRRGLRADLLALDRNWQLLRVLRGGEWVG